MSKEQVNHPQHYGGADNAYEAIKVIEAWELGFCLGNTVKYISRAGKKDKAKELEDLEKAAWYLNRQIQAVKVSKKKESTVILKTADELDPSKSADSEEGIPMTMDFKGWNLQPKFYKGDSACIVEHTVKENSSKGMSTDGIYTDFPIDYAHEIQVAIRFLSTRADSTILTPLGKAQFPQGVIGFEEFLCIIEKAERGELVHWIETEYNTQCQKMQQINTKKEEDHG